MNLNDMTSKTKLRIVLLFLLSIPVISFLLNVIWMLFAGIWIALMELVFGVLLCITVIGIPFGLQHFKLMRLAIYPFGYDLR